jgi:hypothetical protein
MASPLAELLTEHDGKRMRANLRARLWRAKRHEKRDRERLEDAAARSLIAWGDVPRTLPVTSAESHTGPDLPVALIRLGRYLHRGEAPPALRQAAAAHVPFRLPAWDRGLPRAFSPCAESRGVAKRG